MPAVNQQMNQQMTGCQPQAGKPQVVRALLSGPVPSGAPSRSLGVDALGQVGAVLRQPRLLEHLGLEVEDVLRRGVQDGRHAGSAAPLILFH